MSKREFVTGAPQPLGHHRAVNKEEADAALERMAAKVAEIIAPSIAAAVAEQMKAEEVATNGSNGRKMPTKDDEFDTLPPGDQWDSYNMNDAITGRNDRKPGPLDEYSFPDELRGDHFNSLPD